MSTGAAKTTLYFIRDIESAGSAYAGHGLFKKTRRRIQQPLISEVRTDKHACETHSVCRERCDGLCH